MNARIIAIAPALVLSAEKQRDSLVSAVAHSLSVHEYTLRTRVPTLGPKAMRVELQNTIDRLQHQIGRLESVVQDLLEIEAEDTESDE